MRWFIHRLPNAECVSTATHKKLAMLVASGKEKYGTGDVKVGERLFALYSFVPSEFLCHVNMSTIWLKGKIRLLYELAVPLIGIKTREMKAYVLWKTWTRTFVAAFLLIGKTGKHSNCPSIGRWIYTLNYIYWIEYHIAIKKNKPWCILLGIECWAKGFNAER